MLRPALLVASPPACGRVVVRSLMILAGAVVLGCGGDSTSPPAVASVEVTGSASDVIVGNSLQLAAAAKDGSGTTLGSRTFVWTSSANTIATVSNTGMVQGVSAGVATISAASGGKTGSMQITVRPVVTAPTVVTLPASNITASGVRLNGTVNPNGGVTTWTFELGLTAALGETCGTPSTAQPTGPVNAACDISGQPPGRTIFYRVVAQNSAGRTVGATLSTATSRGSAPTITSVTAPATGSWGNGAKTNVTIGFSDPDGDVARLIVTSNNTSVLNGATLDINAAGQTSGTYVFSYSCNQAVCNAGTATVTLVLEDRAGNRSAAVQHTITFSQ
jgi:hypothetical protein